MQMLLTRTEGTEDIMTEFDGSPIGRLLLHDSLGSMYTSIIISF